MSTSLSPRSSGSSGHPTRQQLDELDALLQRMLALPVNHAGDDVLAEIDESAKTPARRAKSVSYRTPEYGDEEHTAGDEDEAAPPRLDAAHVAPTEAKAEGEGWVPLSSTWKPSPHTWKPLAQSWQSAPAQETPASHEVPDTKTEARPSPPPLCPWNWPPNALVKGGTEAVGRGRSLPPPALVAANLRGPAVGHLAALVRLVQQRLRSPARALGNARPVAATRRRRPALARRRRHPVLVGGRRSGRHAMVRLDLGRHPR